MALYEFCAENFTDIPKAIQAGAHRIELCDNLAVGGTTPSLGVIYETLNYTHDHDVPVMVMIRPRGGDFHYNDIELKMMEYDILQAKQLGADGVVFGALSEDKTLDHEAMSLLLDAAQGMQVTFHMAFDHIVSFPKQLEALDWLAAHHVTRILTHGSLAGTPIEQNIPTLLSLKEYAQDKIQLLIGGGVTYQNAVMLEKQTGIHELHGTKIVPITK